MNPIFKAKSIRIFPFILFFMFRGLALAQNPHNKVDQVMYFQSRVNNPVQVEVFESNGKYDFIATNKSYYPYQLEIRFSTLTNLSPMTPIRRLKLLPGRNNLFYLSIINEDQSTNFQYSYKYSIGIESDKVDVKYPYLTPVNKEFRFVYAQPDSSFFYNDRFKTSKGDTVFSMRKGYVVATPWMNDDADRLSKKNCIEVMHDDGTVLIYKNVDLSADFLQVGSVVYPKQALALLDENGIVETDLYMNTGNGEWMSLQIQYFLDDEKVGYFNKYLKSNHKVVSEEVVCEEMTKRERKNTEREFCINDVDSTKTALAKTYIPPNVVIRCFDLFCLPLQP